MRITSEKKEAVMLYILEKIAENKKGISHSVAEAFGISTNTVHVYINELIQQEIVEKNGRDNYLLVSKKNRFYFSRINGELTSEDAIMKKCLLPAIENLPKNVQSIWTYAFSEMVNNVIDHSAAEHLWIEINHNYLRTNVFIFDDGIGVFKKIQSHFNYPTIDDAIIELSKGKLTTDSSHHSGEGIFFTSRIMDEFLLCSDKKMFSINRFYEEVFTNINNEFPFSTGVYLSLSNSSQKNITNVFDEYSDVDNGFVKTRIPLKNLFETSPVSRSQAKRIGSRLEQFKEVELDFEGVEYMGQGFAHEIFYVFANSHPAINLVPLNMNATVEKMYRHVSAPQI